MPSINLCFLWHMHQPFYKDLMTEEYRLPWTRLHALKDYYGMVKVLEDFPTVHQTFNLVPSLLEQVEEYASGKARDRHWKVALKPAEILDRGEREFLLQYSFHANEERLINRYPRYAELLRVSERYDRIPERTAVHFDHQMLRDLQVLSQLVWFDEEYLKNDAAVAELARKGRDFTNAEQALLGNKQFQALQNVLRVYQESSERGQIEISTTPFYHPIVPLLCDSNIAATAHPYLRLPQQFAYPQDAFHQMTRARQFCANLFNQTPTGMWPSEGAVSDDTLELAARAGFQWIASDDRILAKSLNQPAHAGITYKPYQWTRDGQSIQVIFRDHRLSDLIGFVYSRMDAAEAAEHFLNEVRNSARPLLSEGQDALIPIILDGENAWEYYAENGRPFLRELYRRLEADPEINALTITEALQRAAPEPLNHVFPGSWIDSNFDIWIGAEEDNAAWESLVCARATYERVMHSPAAAGISDDNKRLAYEEILIAEGSDWCWWYGPEHTSANKQEFDQLYRAHIANVYRLLAEPVPRYLVEPNLKPEASFHEPPSGLIQPTIDGQISSHTEWTGAGRYPRRQPFGCHALTTVPHPGTALRQ